MSQPVTLRLSTVLQLKKVCDNILYEKDSEGRINERDLPFRLKYRLGKNMTYLDKYTSVFLQNQLYFKANFGTENPETHAIEFEEDGAKRFTYALKELLNKEVIINITTLEPEDIELLTFNTPASLEDVRIFTAFMMNDQDFFKDINSKVDIDLTEILKDAMENI